MTRPISDRDESRAKSYKQCHYGIFKGDNPAPNLFRFGTSYNTAQPSRSKLNCEVLYDDLAFEVRWAVAGDSVVLQLVSKLDDNEYMSFGLSGHPEKSQMVGGDVVVAWVDKATLKGNAFDYYLDSKSQCSGSRGSCPDTRIKPNSNSVRLLNAALVNGYSIVTYQRPLAAHDDLDRPVYTNGTQPVIWAVGPLNARQEVSYHRIANKRNVFLDFGRAPQWNCPLPEDQNANANNEEKDQGIGAANQQVTAVQPQKRPPATPAPHPTNGAWAIPPIQCYEPEDGVFYAQMGPTGGKHGYPAITGHVGWGISWYINGLLIPEINVVRGKTYTFVVEGGLDPETPARYHPFYITDDAVGGYEHKTPQERANVRIFAGVNTDKRGNVTPTGTGRLCNWTPDPAQPSADEFASFGAYQRTLTLVCDDGNPGFVQWTPDANTPDTVYYQCFTHRYLGWKINVLDSCDASAGAASEVVASQIAAPSDKNGNQSAKEGEESAEEGDLEERPSIQVETRVRPVSPNLYGVSALADSAQLLNNPHAKSPLYIVKTVPQNEEPTLNSLKGLSPSFGLHQSGAGTGNPFESIAIDQATLALLQEARQKEYEMHHQHLQQQHESNSDPLPSLAQTGSHQPGKTLYDHLREETVKQEQATEPGLTFQQLQSLSTQYPAFDGLGVGSLPNLAGQVGPSSSLSLDHMKLVPPTMHFPTGHGGPKAARIPLSRIPGQQLMYPHQMKRPTSFGPRRPIMMSHRPAMSMYRPNSLMMPQGPPHNYGMKKKPYYRVPMMSSTTLRPMYVPGYTGRPMTTLRPGKPFQFSGPTKLHQIQSDESLGSSTTITPSPGLIQQSASFSLPNYQHFLMQQQQQLHHLQESSRQQEFEQLRHIQKQNQAARLQSQSHLSQSSLNPAAQSSSHFQQIFQSPFTNRPLSSINSGFNPGSVVVEGGFKPIVQRREDIAQERVDDVDSLEEDDDSPDTGTVKEMERRSSDVSDEEEDDSTNKPFQGQQTETFEPVFIPSPPDRNSLKPGKKSTTGSIVKDSKREHEMMIVRRRPAVLRRPLYPNMVVPPFKIPPRGNSPQFRNKQPTEDISDEELDISPKETSIDTLYPDELLPEASAIHNVVSFDGKSVDAIAPPSGVPSGPGVAAFVRNTPQFGVFKGEIPPLNTDNISSNFRQLQTSKTNFQTDSHSSSRTTLLSPVRSIEESDSEETVADDELVPESSELKETVSLKEKAKNEASLEKPNHKKAPADEVSSEEEQFTTLDDDSLSTETTALNDDYIRKRRSAESHHEPGHEGYEVHEQVHDHDHDHDHEHEQEQQDPHEHDHHQHDDKESSTPKRNEEVKYHDYSQNAGGNSATKTTVSTISFVLLCFVTRYFS